MKELYLGLVITAFIVLVLTITVEVSTTGSYLNNAVNNKNEPTPTTEYTDVTNNDLSNSKPERVYNKNNLNKFFLEKYYENKEYNPRNNFYISN